MQRGTRTGIGRNGHVPQALFSRGQWASGGLVAAHASSDRGCLLSNFGPILCLIQSTSSRLYHSLGTPPVRPHKTLSLSRPVSLHTPTASSRLPTYTSPLLAELGVPPYFFIFFPLRPLAAMFFSAAFGLALASSAAAKIIDVQVGRVVALLLE